VPTSPHPVGDGFRIANQNYLLDSSRPTGNFILLTPNPGVAFQEILEFPERDLCRVRQDDREGGRLVAREAISAATKRIVILLPKVHWPALNERTKGFRAAIRESGIDATVSVLKCLEYVFEDIKAKLVYEIEYNGAPDVILAGSDRIAAAAAKILVERGLKIPDDVRLTGFGALDFCQYATPALTTVRSPAYEIGLRGAVALLARLKDGSFAEPEIIFPMEIQAGAST
jgi:DNA-binding LacI/PurR family transcriptional regulator